MEQMRDDLKKLEEDVTQIRGILSEVHTAIVGNPLTKDGGIAMRLFTAEAAVERLEDEFKEAEKRFEVRINQAHLQLIESEKKQIPYNVWTKIMWVCVGATAMGIFTYILQLIFNKK